MKEIELQTKYYVRKIDWMTQFCCDITRKLDELANLEPSGTWKHYLLKDTDSPNYTIRIPGGTCGLIEADENGIIKNIHVSLEYAPTRATLPKNVDEILNNEFIGDKILGIENGTIIRYCGNPKPDAEHPALMRIFIKPKES